MQKVVQNLLELQSVDVRLNDLRARLAKIPKKIADSDARVSSVDVASVDSPDSNQPDTDVASKPFILSKVDYEAVKPDDEIDEMAEILDIEAQMSAIDFDNSTRWRVKTKNKTHTATVEDAAFLARVAGGLAIRKGDIFRLSIREDTIVKNGRTRTTWTVLQVENHRRASSDDDT